MLTIIANLCGLQKLRDDYADAFGDVPALHGEMRPARKWRGDSEQVGRAVTDGSHSHVGERFR